MNGMFWRKDLINICAKTWRSSWLQTTDRVIKRNREWKKLSPVSWLNAASLVADCVTSATRSQYCPDSGQTTAECERDNKETTIGQAFEELISLSLESKKTWDMVYFRYSVRIKKTFVKWSLPSKEPVVLQNIS